MTSTVQDFLDSAYTISHSENTVINYGIAIKKFQKFLNEKYQSNDQEIIQKIIEKQLKVAEILKEFVIYLDKNNYSPATISMWLGAAKGYLRYCGVKIYSEDLKGIVRIPKQRRIREIPLSKKLIVQLLNVVPLQLKTTIFVAISSGMRIGEIVQVKLSDIDFNSTPTIINLRAETTKNKEARTVFLTQEATSCLELYLEKYFEWKKGENNNHLKDKLIFGRISNKGIQRKTNSYLVSEHKFQRSLMQHIKDVPELNEKSEDGRMVIHYHAFRKFFRTVVGNEVGRDFAEALIGHHFYMDTYYQLSEDQRKEKYLKAEPYLTISDFEKVEKNFHELSTKQTQLEKTVEDLKQYLTNNSVPVPIPLLEKLN